MATWEEKIAALQKCKALREQRNKKSAAATGRSSSGAEEAGPAEEQKRGVVAAAPESPCRGSSGAAAASAGSAGLANLFFPPARREEEHPKPASTAAPSSDPQAQALSEEEETAGSSGTATRDDVPQQGHAEELFCTGHQLEFGKDGKTRDLDRAAKAYLQAAEKGHVKAMWSLGRLYEAGQIRGGQNSSGGDGSPTGSDSDNAEEAAVWYRKAASLGDREAQSALALLLEDGRAAPKPGSPTQQDTEEEEDDPAQAEAFAWHAKAAAQHQPVSLYCLGCMWEEGRGTPGNACDPVEAQRLFRQSAAVGFGPAREALAALGEEDSSGGPGAGGANSSGRHREEPEEEPAHLLANLSALLGGEEEAELGLGPAELLEVVQQTGFAKDLEEEVLRLLQAHKGSGGGGGGYAAGSGGAGPSLRSTETQQSDAEGQEVQAGEVELRRRNDEEEKAAEV